MVKYQVLYYILVQSGKAQTVQSPKNFGFCFLPSYETEVYRETNSQKKKETGQDFWNFLTCGYLTTLCTIASAELSFKSYSILFKLFPIPYKHLHNSLCPLGPSVKLNGPQNPSIFTVNRFFSRLSEFSGFWCWWCNYNAPPWTWCLVVSLVIDSCYKIDSEGIQPTPFYLDF